jgi:hypothetical protein
MTVISRVAAHYSESYWRNVSAPIIRRVLSEFAHTDEPTIRLALRHAYPFGERRHHPYKIWCDEVARQRGRKPKLGTVVNRKGYPTQADPDPRQDSLFADCGSVGGEQL